MKDPVVYQVYPRGRGERRERGRGAELWVDATKVQLFDAGSGRSLRSG